MALNMRPKRNFGSFYANKIALAFFILAIFYTIWNFFIDSSNIFSLLKLEQSNISIERLFDYEKKRYDYLYAKKQQIDASPNYFMKKFAAEYMQMQKPEEKIIILPKSMWFEKKNEHP